MRHQDPAGGSIVCTASAASFQRFRVADYTAAKHGVLGWMRGMIPNIRMAGLPIRVNAISPSWTVTGLVPKELVEIMAQYCEWQEASVVARDVALLMADEGRQGELHYSWGGKYREVEEGVLLPAAKEVVEENDEDMVIEQLHRLRSDIGYS